MKLVNVNVDQMLVFAIRNNVGIKISVVLNVKNRLTKVVVIQELF